MAQGGRPANRQLIAAIILVVVAAAIWIVVRRHEAQILAAGDPSSCWTASCRDAIIQRNMDRTTGADGAANTAAPTTGR